MDIIDTLSSRGLIQDVSDAEGIRKLQPGDGFYVGFDPTAPSLQLGNLVPIMGIIHLSRFKLKPIVIFGGATGSIGDPSGKSNERQLMSSEVIEQNLARQKEQMRAILERAGVKDFVFLNNIDWTKNVSVLDFLRDTGKYFTLNYMIAKEVVKTRLNGEGISFTEFSYMLLQAFDFLHLYQNHRCKLQVGGSDQWGNITAGLELIRKKIQGEAYALSFPLIVDAQGRKFGKSEGGAIWLDAGMTSPYKLHQYLLNVDDASVLGYLRLFTFLGDAELSSLEQNLKSQPEKREAQNKLADQLCTLIHGSDATADARNSAQVLFGGSMDNIPDHKLLEIFQDVPSTVISCETAEKASVLDLLVEAKLTSSRGEAKKLISAGGAYLNNGRVTDAAQPAHSQDSKSRVIVLRAGKKNYHLFRVQ